MKSILALAGVAIPFVVAAYWLGRNRELVEELAMAYGDLDYFLGCEGYDPYLIQLFDTTKPIYQREP